MPPWRPLRWSAGPNQDIQMTAQWRRSFGGIVGPRWVITAAAGFDKPGYIFGHLRNVTLAYANLAAVLMVVSCLSNGVIASLHILYCWRHAYAKWTLRRRFSFIKMVHDNKVVFLCSQHPHIQSSKRNTVEKHFRRKHGGEVGDSIWEQVLVSADGHDEVPVLETREHENGRE